MGMENVHFLVPKEALLMKKEEEIIKKYIFSIFFSNIFAFFLHIFAFLTLRKKLAKIEIGPNVVRAHEW